MSSLSLPLLANWTELPSQAEHEGETLIQNKRTKIPKPKPFHSHILLLLLLHVSTTGQVMGIIQFTFISNVSYRKNRRMSLPAKSKRQNTKKTHKLRELFVYLEAQQQWRHAAKKQWSEYWHQYRPRCEHIDWNPSSSSSPDIKRMHRTWTLRGEEGDVHPNPFSLVVVFPSSLLCLHWQKKTNSNNQNLCKIHCKNFRKPLSLA